MTPIEREAAMEELKRARYRLEDLYEEHDAMLRDLLGIEQDKANAASEVERLEKLVGEDK